VSKSVTPKNLGKPAKLHRPANSPVNKREESKKKVDKPGICKIEGRISPDKLKSSA
jgi:hypothetical protein